MAYVTPGTVAAGDVATAAAWNVITNDVISFRDNSGVVPPACRARRAAVQAMINGSVTAINFDTEDFDTNAMFAATANFVTIKTTGIYVVTAHVSLAASAAGNRVMLIYLNPTYSGAGDSATITAGTVLVKSAHSVGSSTDSNTAESTIYSFTANDKVAVGFFQNSGGNLNTDTTAQCHLAVAMLGATS